MATTIFGASAPTLPSTRHFDFGVSNSHPADSLSMVESFSENSGGIPLMYIKEVS
jgi:hypothetical protein